MHDFIVGERQDEVFGERIQQAERNLILVVTTIDRIMREVVEHVVHPAHIPFERKAEPSGIGGP